MEVIEKARQVTNCRIEVKVEPPRPGDPSRLVANAGKAQKLLGWKPKCPELEAIVCTAWEWHQTYSDGYAPEL